MQGFGQDFSSYGGFVTYFQTYCFFFTFILIPLSVFHSFSLLSFFVNLLSCYSLFLHSALCG